MAIANTLMMVLTTAIRRLLPKNLKMSIRKHKSSDSIAALNRVFTNNDYIVSHIFELMPNKSGIIDVLHLPTIAHEVQHLADSLYNPKITAREQILAKRNMYKDKFLNFYVKLVELFCCSVCALNR